MKPLLHMGLLLLYCNSTAKSRLDFFSSFYCRTALYANIAIYKILNTKYQQRKFCSYTNTLKNFCYKLLAQHYSNVKFQRTPPPFYVPESISERLERKAWKLIFSRYSIFQWQSSRYIENNSSYRSSNHFKCTVAEILR